jgi:RimJ/RimL family protein N-acetyltransferase
LEIRRLVPDDAVAYRALRLRALAEHPDAFTSSHEEETRRPLDDTLARLQPDGAEAVWGAFLDGALVGSIGLARERRAKNRHKAVVFGMYVAAEHAGRGMGAVLLARVVDEARRLPGLLQLVLTVTDTNIAARRLYERQGFDSFGVEPRAIRIGGDYLAKNHMILFLDRP